MGLKKIHHASENVGHAVTQLVEALRCKPEVREFNSRLCHWNIS
jgi:hypothetical protein